MIPVFSSVGIFFSATLKWWPELFFLARFPSSLLIKLYALFFHVTSSMCSGNKICRSFWNTSFRLPFLLAALSRAHMITTFKQERLCNFISDLTLFQHHLKTTCLTFGISISFKTKLKIFNWYYGSSFFSRIINPANVGCENCLTNMVESWKPSLVSFRASLG